MKPNPLITAVTIAQDYHRGWEISQKEYLRQQKQAQRQNINRSVAWLSIIRK